MLMMLLLLLLRLLLLLLLLMMTIGRAHHPRLRRQGFDASMLQSLGAQLGGSSSIRRSLHYGEPIASVRVRSCADLTGAAVVGILAVVTLRFLGLLGLLAVLFIIGRRRIGLRHDASAGGRGGAHAKKREG